MKRSFLVKINFILFLLFAWVGLKAQDAPIKQVLEFPTKEVYDIHVDRHGFLWIASDFGISRFDGVSFVHFSHPRQISLGCTNLLEDNYGRIWFNNFNGQIFYIDHETVTLLEAYDHTKERNFPRMALFKDQLLATSDKGLFVLDTKTLAGKYINNGSYTSSLSVLKKEVLVRGDKTWYSYNGTTDLKKIAYKGDAEIKGDVYLLTKDTYRETVYMMVNPTGIVKKMVLQHDTLKQCGQIVFNNFINTISITADDQLVNTNYSTYSLKNGAQVTGQNISAVATDHEGNKWFGSLYYGLLIQYKKDIASKTIVPGLDGDDMVISVKNYRDNLLLGTQKGFVVLYNPATKQTAFKIKVAPNVGSINYLAAIGKDEYMVASSLATYKITIPTKTITELPSIKTVKQLCYDDNAIYIASTSGLFVIPRQQSPALNKRISAAFGHIFKYDTAENYFYLRVRSRSIAYFPEQSSLFVAIKNNLFKIDKNGMAPYLFNQEQVYAASLSYIDHRLYIGTISNGMLVVEKDDIKHISVQNGLFSKSIFKIKPVDKNLWILGSGPLQIFNTQKKALVDNYEFPDRSASEVLDIDGVKQMIYLATSSGLDNFPLVKTASEKKLKNYLLYVKVNNRLATDSAGHKLSYSENNVVFNIGIPAYSKAREIYIKYCLVTKTDSTWLTTEPGERTIHFSSLMPGEYTLKAIAVDPRLGMADTVIKYDFAIEEPWWRGVSLKIILLIAFVLFVFYGYAMMLRKRLSLKKAFDTQQQLISAERQRISSEMHDDIGSGVFAIQSLANKASKNGNGSAEIDQIKQMVIELSDKIRDVIWSTNVGNDNLENLMVYTYVQIGKLFEHADIEFVSELPDDIPDVKITIQSRRNVYLLVKEVVHNAIKHSKASTIELKMFTDEQNLYFAIIDNGVGIHTDGVKQVGHGMGLGNIASRVEKFNGQLSMENKDGAHINIKIPLYALQHVEFDKKLSKWQLTLLRILKHPVE